MKYVAHIKVVLDVARFREARFIVDWIVETVRRHWFSVKEVSAYIEGTHNGNVGSHHGDSEAR